MPKSTTARESESEIDVDTDQADTAKAVNRQPTDDDRRALKSEESDDERKHSDWLSKSRAVNRRMSSFQRNLTKQFDQKQAEIEARHQREMREMKEQMNGLKVDREGDASDTAHEAEMEKLQGELEAAIEAGNSKEQAKLNALISRKEAAHMAAKTARLAVGRQTESKDEKREAAQPRVSKKAQEFISNTPWWDEDDHWEEKAFANALHARMVDSGSDPESDAHYAKITKELHKKFPDLEVDESLLDDDKEEGDEEEEEEPAPRRRAPVRNFKDRGGDERPANVRGGKIQLTKADIETMKMAKLDPTDNNHVLAFAKAKRERIESEGA